MATQPSNDPLHGVTLKAILEDLVARHGWPGLAAHIPIRCFDTNPSIQSSLKFLRKTEWARRRVERLYLDDKDSAGFDDRLLAMARARGNRMEQE